MNATTAIGLALLKGDVLTIRTAFRDFGVTNISRECGRLIERKFGLKLARVRREGFTRYGMPCFWFEYRLPKTKYNKDGRKKLLAYCLKNKINYR